LPPHPRPRGRSASLRRDFRLDLAPHQLAPEPGTRWRLTPRREPPMRELRYMDKLIDALAKGRKMEKILRA
jgi:hypothetical protein